MVELQVESQVGREGLFGTTQLVSYQEQGFLVMVVTVCTETATLGEGEMLVL